MGQDGAYGAAGGLTVGVEEEFLVVDPATGRTVPRAAEVLARAATSPAAAPDAALHPELSAGQLEAATGVCTTLDGLRVQLADGRRRLAAAAAAEGLRLLSTGTPVLDGPVGVSGGERFGEIVAAFAGVVGDYQACGCHVHVGVPDTETAVAVVNHLRPWLPTLAALSANSPFDRGRDSGFASWRLVQQARFPGAGVPPWFGSAADYRAGLGRLVECGALVDESMTFWLARPSPHLPTVELRAADAAGSVEEAVVQAALSRALVRTALTELAAGREGSPVDDQVAAAALWAAARYGLAGAGVDPLAACRVPAAALLHRLVSRVSAALEDAGDLSAVRAGVTRLLAGGTGAERQRRAAAEGGPEAVVDMLAAQTDPGPPR
ncbi:carboxylate-amine ligase [Streptacidiphilus griseoplanus]|uniref:carboxylate-amine ligase n=1 Tax=Peterkaempfera griseoplana TaxID=66896 RepID=UPI0006E32C08|nr:glutamate--cysteine ligase [Peterkaempfera griseoplana]